MIGQTISHYKILEKLGEGGMGVVYKAEDTKLRRAVALKILPRQALISDEDKLRFAHEAQAAASLSHPNIAMIHEFDEVDDPVTGGKLSFIAMEYIDGETLKKRIQERPLPIPEVVNIAIAVAEGLAKAHEKGIIHRDIKSDNVMISRDGVVKIMDFGLAEIAGRSRVTKEGMTVGTVAYMSPEQALGEKLDQRTDTWSLGAVLYEMVTGRVPFPGDYEQAIMYRILNEEPEPITGLRSNVPMELERIVNKCLEKKPAERYQSMVDLLIDLRRLRKETGGVSRTVERTIEHRKRRKRTLLALACVSGLTILVIATVMLLSPPSLKLNPGMTVRPLEIAFTNIESASLSRDGNWIAFSTRDAPLRYSVYHMSVARGSPQKLVEESATIYEGGCEISPDGSEVLYSGSSFDSEPCIKVIPHTGGVGRVVARRGGGGRWRRDGKRICYIRGPWFGGGSQSGKTEYWSVRPDGSDTRLEFIDSLGVPRGSADWSWDGRSIAFLRVVGGENAEVWIHSLESGTERQLTSDKSAKSDISWGGIDKVFYSSDRGGTSNIWMVSTEGGEPTQVTKGAGPDQLVRATGDGNRALVLEMRQIGHMWRGDLAGRAPRQLTYDKNSLWLPVFSPDKSHIGFYQHSAYALGWVSQAIVMDSNGTTRIRLGQEGEFTGGPTWSPDGKWVIYDSRAATEPWDSTRLYLVDAENLGNPQYAGRGAQAWWIDAERFVSISIVEGTGTLTRSALYSIHRSTPIKEYEDSTVQFPLPDGIHTLVEDFRKGKEGWWLTSSAKPDVVERLLTAEHLDRAWPSVSLRYLLYPHRNGETWRVSLPEGKHERLPSFLDGLVPRLQEIQFSLDDRDVLYVKFGWDSKLVLIDRVFE